jgi:hypothetical protein
VHGRLADPFLITVQDLLAGVCAVWLGETAQAGDRLRRAAAAPRTPATGWHASTPSAPRRWSPS